MIQEIDHVKYVIQVIDHVKYVIQEIDHVMKYMIQEIDHVKYVIQEIDHVMKYVIQVIDHVCIELCESTIFSHRINGVKTCVHKFFFSHTSYEPPYICLSSPFEQEHHHVLPLVYPGAEHGLHCERARRHPSLTLSLGFHGNRTRSLEHVT